MSILASTSSASTAAGWGGMIIWLVVLFGFMYFFMIRPQMKRQKELKNFRDSLKKGDKIVTTGGIYGKVLEIGDYYIIMEVEGQNRLKIDKSAVIKDMTDATPAK